MPISLSDYYRGGANGNVPAGQGDAGFGIIPTGTPGTPISMMPFRNQTRLGGSAPPPPPPPGGAVAGYDGTTIMKTRLTSQNAVTVSEAYFRTDGSCVAAGTPNAQVSFHDTFTGTNWYSPTTTSIGNSYYARATSVGGQAPNRGATLNVWHQLNNIVSWGMSVNMAFQTREGNILVEISTSPSGSPVVASGNVIIRTANEF